MNTVTLGQLLGRLKRSPSHITKEAEQFLEDLIDLMEEDRPPIPSLSGNIDKDLDMLEKECRKRLEEIQQVRIKNKLIRHTIQPIISPKENEYLCNCVKVRVKSNDTGKELDIIGANLIIRPQGFFIRSENGDIIFDAAYTTYSILLIDRGRQK